MYNFKETLIIIWLFETIVLRCKGRYKWTKMGEKCVKLADIVVLVH